MGQSKKNAHLDRNLIIAIYKVLLEKLYTILTLSTLGFLSRLLMDLGDQKAKKASSLKYILHILQWCRLAQLPKEDHYPNKTPKLYKSRDTLLEFGWHQDYFIKNQQILLYQEIQINIALEHNISNSFNFFEPLKIFLINMVRILMMSAKVGKCRSS